MKLSELVILIEQKLPNSFGNFELTPQIIKRLEKINPLSDEIKDALKNKEILNQRFIFIKDQISRLADDVDEMVRDRYFFGGKYRELPEELRNLDLGFGIQGIRSWPNKIKKIKIDHPLIKDIKHVYNDFKPFIDIVDDLKPLVVKKTEKLAKEREVKSAYQQQLVKHGDVKKVIDMLKETADSIRKAMLKEYEDYFQKIADGFEKSGETDPRKYTKDPNKLHFLIQKKDPKKEAERAVNEIFDQFIYKSTRKLAFILNKKNNLKSVKITNINWGRGKIEARINCEFKDGSSFIMNHQIVAVWTATTSFYRYPSTFHRVVFADGTHMKMPSIEKMEKQFV